MRGARSFSSVTKRAAEVATRIEASNKYGVRVAKAQSHVNGFVGGKFR